MHKVRSITVSTEFTGMHYWKDAPDEVSFLRYPHRHRFVVNVEIGVSHGDRQVEFFIVQGKLNEWIDDNLKFESNEAMPLSCEDMADKIGTYLISVGYNVLQVSVSEDGENTGTVTWLRDTETDTTKPPERRELFQGLEAEGPFKGLRTLFIPEVYGFEPEDIRDLLNHDSNNFEQVYFGAGWCRGFDRELFIPLIPTLVQHDVNIMVELDGGDADLAKSLRELAEVNLDKLHVVIATSELSEVSTLVSLSFFPERSWVKYVTDTELLWIPANTQLYHTHLNDPLFNEDTTIE